MDMTYENVEAVFEGMDETVMRDELNKFFSNAAEALPILTGYSPSVHSMFETESLADSSIASTPASSCESEHMPLRFLCGLYRALEASDGPLRWDGSGTKILLLDKCDLASNVLPTFMRSPNNHTRLDTFYRQLRHYGFKNDGRDVYHHVNFKRDEPHLMRRCTGGRRHRGRSSRRRCNDLECIMREAMKSFEFYSSRAAL